MQLVTPAHEHLPSYIAALKQGWSPDNTRPERGFEELAEIEKDADAFLAGMTDLEATSGDVTLPDGSKVKRLPFMRRWMWDGEFCGSIGLRWQNGTPELPNTCLGHIGYSVVPWKSGKGCATKALGLILAEARAVGLPYVELTTDPDNIASQKVIEANKGIMTERFIKGPEYGHKPALRWRIDLDI
ncbi:MAG TPA: GNAT family N-acetyltransferase [Alphaproteobacteria bacterium]|nr:GNAT family N-acetyltransferase [Alphaproteobacteria bacterium]